MKNVIFTLFVSLMPHIALMVGLVFQVYVWHTRTESPKLNMEEKLRAKGVHSDAGMEVWSGNVWDIRICTITTQIDIGRLFWLGPVLRTCVREIGHRLSEMKNAPFSSTSDPLQQSNRYHLLTHKHVSLLVPFSVFINL